LVFHIPFSKFSLEFDVYFVFGTSNKINGELSDKGHVLGSVAFSKAAKIIFEGHVELPMENIFDLPMGVNSLI
jgi:hypothetical protein